MIPESPNPSDDLQRRLDRAIPPGDGPLPPIEGDDPLVKAARRLADAPSVELSNAALDRIEARLMAHVDALERFQPAATRPRRTSPRVVRWLAYAAAACLVMVMVAGGATVASADSLPGDTLYSVKRTVEQVRLALVAGADEAALRVELAERRLDEFAALLSRDEVYPRALEEASEELERALTSGRNGALGQRIADIAQEQERLSQRAQTRASDNERVVLERIATESRQIRERAMEPTPTPALPEPPLLAPVTPSATPSDTAQPTLTPTATNMPTNTPLPTPTVEGTATPPPTPSPRPPQVAPPVVAPTRTPPGHGETPGLGDNPPGQGGPNPGVGNQGQPPGQSGDAPGNSGSAPGQSDNPPPGQGGVPPGQSGDPPGNSGSAPGQSDNPPPGQGGVPPGQGGSPPGSSGSAPGQSDNPPPGQGGNPPELEGNPPPGQGRGSN